MNEQIPTYISGLIGWANRDIKKYGKQLQINCQDDGFYSLDILTIDKVGNVIETYEFAENYFESELTELVNDAWANVRCKAKREHDEDDTGKTGHIARKMNLDDLIHGTMECRDQLEDIILDFVKDNGEDCQEYHMNEFGLADCLDEEESVTKVYDFYDKKGCYYIGSAINKSIDFNEIKNDNQDEEAWEINRRIETAIDNTFEFTSIHCLYIVRDKDGNERLCYYCFTNGGCSFDDNLAEPHHGNASELNFLDLERIIDCFHEIFTK